MPRTPRIQFIEDVGGTIRMAGPRNPGICAVLVVGDGLTSHFWLNILPLCREENLRYFVSEEDLLSLEPHLHVRPTLVPCFLVFAAGFPVDWFPAPLPGAGRAVDPMDLLQSVGQRLESYRYPSNTSSVQ